VTKFGLGKKIESENILNIKRSGVQIIKLLNNDSLLKVLYTDKENILIFTKNGFALNIKEGIPVQGKSSKGVRIIKLDQNDEIFNASLINKDFVLVLFENGFVKKFPVKEINPQKRGGKGIKIFDIKEKIGNPVYIDIVNNGDKILISNEKIEIVSVSDIKEIKRTNQPIKISSRVNYASLI